MADSRKKFIKNSMSGIAQMLVTTILTLTAIPVFIGKLGAENYGIFSLISVVGNVNVFVNLGLNISLIKFLAEQGKTKESNYDIIVTIFIIVILVLPITSICTVYSSYILKNILNVPLHSYEDALQLYYYVIWASCLVFIGQTFNAILDSQQKIFITNTLQLLYSIIYWGLLILAVLLGYSLGELGLVILIAAILWFIATATAAIIVWGKFEWTGLRGEIYRTARKQISYGKNIYVSSVVNFFYEPFARILISNFIGIREVGYFDIAIKVKGQVVNLASKIMYPLFPLFSSLADLQKVKRIVTDIQQKIFFIVVPCISIVIFVTYPVVALWIGKSVEVISFSIIFLTCTNLLFCVSLIPIYHFAGAKNHTNIMIYTQFANVIASVATFFILLRFLGYSAVIFGNAVGTIAGFSVLVIFQKRELNSFVFSSLIDFLKFLGLLVICLFAPLCLSKIFSFFLWNIFIIPILIGLLAIVLYRNFKVFSEKDIKFYFDEHARIRPIMMKLLIK